MIFEYIVLRELWNINVYELNVIYLSLLNSILNLVFFI